MQQKSPTKIIHPGSPIVRERYMCSQSIFDKKLVILALFILQSKCFIFILLGWSNFTQNITYICSVLRKRTCRISLAKIRCKRSIFVMLHQYKRNTYNIRWQERIKKTGRSTQQSRLHKLCFCLHGIKTLWLFFIFHYAQRTLVAALFYIIYIFMH